MEGLTKNPTYYVSKAQGFTLIEALVAFAVLAIGMVALAKFQANIMVWNARAKSQTAAIDLAEEKIEQLRNFADLSEFWLLAGGSDAPEQMEGCNARFLREWTVAESVDPSYKLVSVTVNWTCIEGSHRSVRLTTHISKVDPVESGKLLLMHHVINP